MPSAYKELKQQPGGQGEEVDKGSFDVWKLKVGGSVYGAAFLAPNIRGNKTTSVQYSTLYCTVTFVLLVNFALQYLVMHKVQRMTIDADDDTKGRLLGKGGVGGLCMYREPGSFPRMNHIKGSSDDVAKDMDCSMLTVSLLSNMSLIRTGDKYWTRHDANKTGTHWELDYHKLSSLRKAFDTFTELARSGELLAQKAELAKHAGDPDELHKKWKSETNNYKRLPFAWLEAEQGRIDLCIGVSPKLCGNFEMRGILEHKLGKVSEDDEEAAFESRDERIQACRDVLNDYCPRIFGELYRCYVDWAEELCGVSTAVWHNELRMITSVFEMADLYYGRKSSVTSQAYQTFLFLILLIWMMSMFREVRRVLTWWVVVLLFPTKPPTVDGKPSTVYVRRGSKGLERHTVPEDQPEPGFASRTSNLSHGQVTSSMTKKFDLENIQGNCCFADPDHAELWDDELEPGKFKVVAVPPFLKYHCIFFHLLPRTFIALNLPLIGAKFLISASSPADLILNSVALAFLIEIDEMLFGATASDSMTSSIDNTEELEVDVHGRIARCMELCHDYLPYMFSFTTLLMCIVGYLVHVAYTDKFGKRKLGAAFQCLCQSEGDFCISAQVLGGHPIIGGEHEERQPIFEMILQIFTK